MSKASPAREGLRVGDSLVDAPEFLLHLGVHGGALVDARLRGNFVLQYAVWLGDLGTLPSLQTLLLETPAAGQNWGPVFEQLARLELPGLRTLVVGRGGSTRKWVVPQLPLQLLSGLMHLELDGRLDGASFEGKARRAGLRAG